MKRLMLLLLIAGGVFVMTAGDADAHWRGRGRGVGFGYGPGFRGSGFSISFNRGFRGGYGYYGRRPLRRGFGVISMESNNRNGGTWAVAEDSTGKTIGWWDMANRSN